jgi:hypothetical protein
MLHPIHAYLDSPKDGHVSDELAREDITGLVNDQELVAEACALFHEKMNMDATCYSMGKVYDASGESFGCVSIISEDVAGIIGESLQDVQESINYALVSAYLGFRDMCRDQPVSAEAWDEYLDLVLARNFPPFHKNGMRAVLVHNSRIAAARLPVVVFAVYQQYEAL